MGPKGILSLAIIGTAVFGAIASQRAKAIAVVQPDGDVVINTSWVTGTTGDFLDNNAFYYFSSNSVVEGSLHRIDPPGSIENVGNVFHVSGVSAFGEYGLYYHLLNGDQPDEDPVYAESIWVGFFDPSPIVAQPFETVFADFLATHPHDTEESIIAAFKDPENVVDVDDTVDEDGHLAFQFRDYLVDRSDTRAPVFSGTLTLIHFGDGTAFGTATADVLPLDVPEPATLSCLLVGGSTMMIRRRRK